MYSNKVSWNIQITPTIKFLSWITLDISNHFQDILNLPLQLHVELYLKGWLWRGRPLSAALYSTYLVVL